MMGRALKDLNVLVKRHKNLVLLFLGAVIILSLSKNMFGGFTPRKTRRLCRKEE